MIELFKIFLGIAAGIMGVWLAFIPWYILIELRKQGAAREVEAKRIISLLSVIAGEELPVPAGEKEALRLQAIADIQAQKPA